MLKIRDGIDLKELWKYGFKYEKGEDYYFYDETGDLGGYDEIIIGNDRIIQLGFEPCPYFIEECLYDLINARLVEKVEE